MITDEIIKNLTTGFRISQEVATAFAGELLHLKTSSRISGKIYDQVVSGILKRADLILDKPDWRAELTRQYGEQCNRETENVSLIGDRSFSGGAANAAIR